MGCKILSNDTISDKEFLGLMIKHHNVAIKMSQLIQMNSSDDYILHYARKVIYNQSMEVNLLERLFASIPNVQNEKSCDCCNTIISAKIHKIYPGIFSNIKCDNAHFENFGNTSIQITGYSNYELLPGNSNYELLPGNSNYELLPNKQIEDFAQIQSHTDHKLTDKEYINHMIAHHKSGVELSKLVMKSTKEPKILTLAQNIILDQEKEMFELTYLYNCIKYNWRQINSMN